MNFQGKVALITGASAGIGRAAAIKFAMCGAKVVIVDINAEGLQGVKNEILQYTDDVLSFVTDVANEDEVNNTVDAVIKQFGSVDILVNNAGIFRDYESLVESSSDKWKRYIDVNILGVMYFAKAVLPSMMEKGYGRIINMGSVAGVYGKANQTFYSMTKGAVISFTMALAKEVGHKGVTVNCISPGSVSDSADPDYNKTSPTELSFLGRTGSHMENANLICFIASDEAAYISGQNVQIDGCRKYM